MSNRRERKAARKAVESKKRQEQMMNDHPEWCYCEEILHKTADIDENNPIGQTEPVDGFPNWNSTGYTQNIYRCNRCGKQYCIPMAFAATPVGFEEPNHKELVGKLIAAVSELANKSYVGKANYMMIPEKNIQSIADNFGLTKEQAVTVLKQYFAGNVN